MRRLQVSGFAVFVTVVTAVVVAPLLLLTHRDDSYTCRAGALVEVIHPEPEMGAQFRRDVAFDAGYACNRTARIQVAIAGGLILGAGVIIVRHRWRERTGRASVPDVAFRAV